MIPSPHILLNNGKENKIMINSKIQTQILISNSKRRLRRHIYGWGHLPGLSATSRESEIFNPILNTRKQLSYLVLRDLVAPRSVTPAPSNSQWLSAAVLVHKPYAPLLGCCSSIWMSRKKNPDQGDLQSTVVLPASYLLARVC